jgi:hypothetical protein
MNATSIQIPYPENPEHTDNLASIPLLEAQGWSGIDASLEISIFEYDAAWRILDNGDLLFLYKNSEHASNGIFFHRTRIAAGTDLEKEYNWADFDSLCKTLGTNLEEWRERPLEQKYFDMLNIWGSQNVFGTQSHAGFQISEE